METIAQDVRYSLRMLRKQPLSNGVIVLTIALLISAVSVLYTAETDTRAGWAPYPDRDRIVSFWRVSEHKTIALFSADLFHGFRDGITAFEALGALRGSGQVTLTGMGDPASYRSISVTKDVFDITRPIPVQGRLFAEEEYAEASDRLVLISEQLWREKLDADTNIIGGELLLDDKTCTVIGVMPAAMRTTLLAHEPDVWRPLRVDWGDPIGHLRLIAKLKPGASRRNAQAELDVLAPRLESQHTLSDWEKRWGPAGFKTARIVPATKPRWIADNETPPEIIFSYVFAGLLVACIVGITCFNITNLLLAGFSARAREISIRLALGAGRLAVVRQLLTETLLLSLLGGTVGLLASFWLSDLLRLHHLDPKMDWRLYLLAFSGAAALGMLVGLVPAMRSSRKDLTESLKEGGATVGGRTRHRLRDLLVASEVGMASILCLVSGVMIRSALEYYRGDLGFEPDHLLCVSIRPRGITPWNHREQAAYAGQGLQALREISGVERVSVCVGHYFTRWMPKETILLPGSAGGEGERIQIACSRITRDFPEMFGMPLVRGRPLSDTASGAAGEALVNEAFVARYFPGKDPIGGQLTLAKEGRPLRIVGVTRDRHQRMSFAAIEPEVFCDFRSSFAGLNLLFFAQTRSQAKSMAIPIRESIARIDVSQPVPQPELLSDVLANRAAAVLRPMLTMGSLAAVGLLIALAGVYGVVSFSVVERTREVGIRMAMGATRRQILSLMVWQGIRLMLLGLPMGLLIGVAVFLAAPPAAFLGGVPGVDAPTSIIVLLLIGFVGISASLIAAGKATIIQPMEALRSE